MGYVAIAGLFILLVGGGGGMEVLCECREVVGFKDVFCRLF